MSPPPVTPQQRERILDGLQGRIYGDHHIRPSNIPKGVRNRVGVKLIAILDIIVYLTAVIPVSLQMFNASMERYDDDMHTYKRFSNATLSFGTVMGLLTRGESCLKAAFSSKGLEFPALFVIMQVTNVLYDVGAVLVLWAIPIWEAVCLLHTTTNDNDPARRVPQVIEWLLTSICFFFFHLFHLYVFGPYWISSLVFVVVRLMSIGIVTDYGKQLDAASKNTKRGRAGRRETITNI